MRIFLILVFLILISSQVFAQQSKAELEKVKKQTLNEILEAEKILSETEDKKMVSIGQLNALKNQINARERLIKSIDKEIELLNNQISESNILIDALEDDLENLKKEYASMVYVTYKANEGFNRLTFIFSAKSFHQFFMRLKYMEQYSKARKNQVAEIEKVQQMLQGQIAAIKDKNEEKQKLREQQLDENRSLLSNKDKQDKLIRQLTSKENQLKAELAEKRSAVAKLDKMIAELVAKEIANANKESVSAKEKSEFIYASSSFEDNKNKLKWPVTTGFISGKFGVHPHPVLKNIMEKNDGVNIQTNSGEKVHNVFDGKVTKVAIAPPPFYNVVLIQHGEYFTVYSKLKIVYVKTGQRINVNDIIGEVYTDKEGVSELHFMVWKNNQKLDPENWLVKK